MRTKVTSYEEAPLDSLSLMPILFDHTSPVGDPNKGYLLAEAVNEYSFL